MVYLYLSLRPEALVFSMLPPKDFGRYLALGTEKRMGGEAMFFEIDIEAMPSELNLSELRERCQPHPDGSPRKSTYVAIYRVLEQVPHEALGKLYLVTRDGTSLALEKGEIPPVNEEEKYHLYQEFCPVSPRVVSRLGPEKFAQYITNPDQAISLPRLVFAEFELGPLAVDPNAPAPKLPYRNLDHLRYCINHLEVTSKKPSKIVQRESHIDAAPYWLIKGGVYVGDIDGIVCYPMPTEDELRKTNFNWWSSARAVEVL